MRMNTRLICLTVCITATLTGCAQTRTVGGLSSEGYGYILRDDYWLKTKHEPPYNVITIDGKSISRTIELFTYAEDFKVSPGEHTVEYVCANSADGRRRAIFPVAAGYAYFLAVKLGRNLVSKTPIARDCPYGSTSDADCTIRYEYLYKNTCDLAVAQIPVEHMELLRQPPFDFAAVGASFLPKTAP